MSLSSLLSSASRHLELGLAAQTSGDIARARREFLLAAEALFNAAKESRGQLKETRTKQAEELMKRAEALGGEARHKGDKGQTVRADETARTESDWLIAERPHLRFDDVAGLDQVKEQIRLKLIYPFTHPEAAQRFGIKSGGGILLYGPPGTGKTMIARAVAGEIDAAFFAVKPSEIMSKWVGEAEQNIQKLFEAARAYPRSVVFVDEVESLVPKRRESGSTVMQRVVPQILAELDGFEKRVNALLFVGATNEPWSLDPAVMRPGRFDEKIYVPLPDAAARRRLVEISLRDRPLARDVSLDDLAQMLEGYSGADIVNLCAKACAIPFTEHVQRGTMRDVERKDFLTVCALVKPSVDKKELAKYEKWAGGEQ